MRNRHEDLMAIIDTPVDVKGLIDRLFFSLDGLEDAALNQSKYYLRASKLRTQTLLQLESLERRLSVVMGERSMSIRRHYPEDTEAAIKGRLSADSHVRGAQKKLGRAKVYDEFAKQVLEAYRQRLMMLVALVKLQASEIQSEVRAAKGEAAVNTMRKEARRIRDGYTELGDE